MSNSRGIRGFARGMNNRQRLVHLIYGKIQGTGTAAVQKGSQELSITDNGVGDYTLTYANAYVQLPAVVATTRTADSILVIDTEAVGSVRIKAFDATDGTTAKDVDFNVIIIGSDAADEV